MRNRIMTMTYIFDLMLYHCNKVVFLSRELSQTFWTRGRDRLGTEEQDFHPGHCG